MMRLIFVLLSVASSLTYAKEIVRGDEAKVLYEELVAMGEANADSVVIREKMYFGDIDHPERGRLWLTTIYPVQETVSRICHQYDYREIGLMKYLCEIYTAE